MRATLTTLLLLAATSASADSVKVTEAGDTAYYVDRASITSKGDIHRVPVVHDYAKPEPGGVRSRRVIYDVDCGRERLRSLSGTEYAEPMAQGKNMWHRRPEAASCHERLTGRLSNSSARAEYRVNIACIDG